MMTAFRHTTRATQMLSQATLTTATSTHRLRTIASFTRAEAAKALEAISMLAL